MEIKLGSKVKDIVTDLEGIATARVEFLNGCIRYIVQPPGLDKDGKPKSDMWVDLGQLKVIGTGVSKTIEPKKTGGPTGYTVTGRR